MELAGRSTGQVRSEIVLSTTLVDAHAKPAVDAGSIPAASTSVMTRQALASGGGFRVSRAQVVEGRAPDSLATSPLHQA